jgi:hypothetical protein
MKRLTKQETENRIISKIIHRIMKLEKVYEPRLVERACFRYKMDTLKQRKAMKTKQRLEEELAQIKRRLR